MGKIEQLEQKYDALRNEHVFEAGLPIRLVNIKTAGLFEGVLLSFDVELLIRPSRGVTEPGTLTVRSCQLRRSADGISTWVSMPGKKTGRGNWFNFFNATGFVLDMIRDEAFLLYQESERAQKGQS